jgi:hypothetical protein
MSDPGQVMLQMLSGASEDISTTFTRQTGNGLTLYMAAMINVTDAANSFAGGYFLHLGNRIDGAAITTIENQFCGRVFSKVDASGNVQFGASNTSTATYSSTLFAKNTPYLVIVKYVLFTGTDSVKMWIKTTGVPATEAAAGTPDVELSIDSATDAGLPVELTSFTAIAKGRGVELAWKTASEVNNAGFEIERNVNGSWNKIGYVEGNGTTNAPKSYNYTDVSAKGTVSYRLKQVDNDGKFEYSNVVEVAAGITAADYELSQNFPNPFNPNTNITFAMKNAEHVNVTVYNSLGQAVATLFTMLHPQTRSIH